jgi:predicted RNase H-like HicB family nuclease
MKSIECLMAIFKNLIGRNATYGFDVIIIEDETGGYAAFVPALPGCHTQGDMLQELMENAREAIELYLETLTEEEKKELASKSFVKKARTSL